MKYDFIEIGTSDFDTLLQTTTNRVGLSIEPLSVYLENLPNNPTVTKVNCAIGDTNQYVDIYWIDPNDIKKYNLPDWFRGCNSIINPHWTGEEELKSMNLGHLYKTSKVECITWGTLVEKYYIESVEYLKIDTEGHDCIIINNILSSNSVFPKKIKFECNVLTNKDLLESTLANLKFFGYEIMSNTNNDIIVEKKFKQMSIDKIIFAVDDNPTYSGFWEINSEICTKVLGITPVLFHITNEDSGFYTDKFGIVKKVKAIEGINTGFQAQIYRIYGTSYFQDEVCMLSDIDMLLFNKKYITDSVQNYDENDFVILGYDAYDSKRPECQGAWALPRIPMCYVAGKGKTFDKIANTFTNFKEYCEKMNALNLGWDTDEVYLGNMIERNKTVKIHKLKRGYSSTFSAGRRIEKRDFENLNDIGRLNLRGILNLEHYIDCHCARPLHQYSEQIINLKNQILNHTKEITGYEIY